MITLDFDFRHPLELGELRARGVMQFTKPDWVHAVMGPSGSGKSTFARWLAGLVSADGGHLRWNTTNWSGLAPQQRRIGFMAQGDTLFPHLNVLRNVAYGLRRWPRARRAARVNDILTLTGLKGLEMRRPQTLSGGEKRRASLAQVLAIQPDLLILDEPFTGLDQDSKKQLWLELRRWIETFELPTLLLTHDLVEAQALTGRIHRFEGHELKTGLLASSQHPSFNHRLVDQSVASRRRDQ